MSNDDVYEGMLHLEDAGGDNWQELCYGQAP